MTAAGLSSASAPAASKPPTPSSPSSIQRAVVAFGSDWPVAPLAPLIGIYAAVTRRTIDGKNPNGWQPQQKITVAQALKAYTWAAAYAEGEEKVKGTIEPGKYADLNILERNIFTIDPVEIENVKVDATYLGGELTYSRNP